MRIDGKELAHYIVGAAFLLAAWVPLMGFFRNDVVLTSIAWTLWYIIIDQVLHVVIKKEKISIVR